MELIRVCRFRGGNPNIFSAVSSLMLNVAPIADLSSLYQIFSMTSSVLLLSHMWPAYWMIAINTVCIIRVRTRWLNPH